MKFEEPNWFSKWEDELPTPDELMPLSQTLISTELALAFDIPRAPNSTSNYQLTPPLPNSQSQSQSQSQQQQQQVEYDSSDLGGGGSGGGGDEQARTLKRPRLVWTPQLHKRFVDAVAHLGIKNAVPKTIMQLMSVDGLTRENVASHLQKYRLYLKRMQGLSSGTSGVSGGVPGDSSMEDLFASSPIPHHFLNRGPPVGLTGEQFMPFPPQAVLQHQQQMAAAAAAAAVHQQQQIYHHRNMGHLGSPHGNGFDLGFQTQHQQPTVNRIIGTAGLRVVPPPTMGSCVDDLETGAGGAGRKILTLFPTNDD